MATTKVLRKQSAAKGIFLRMAAKGSGEYRALANIRFEPKANAHSQHIRTF
jgi:hypothetical protein